MRLTYVYENLSIYLNTNLIRFAKIHKQLEGTWWSLIEFV